jgi:hypothetical protein
MIKTAAIKPQAAFANGKRMTATQFNVVSISDNLFDHAIFKYTLLDANGTWAGESTFELTTENYGTWDTTAEGAYKIVADGIGVELAPSVGKSFTFSEVA